MRDRFLTPNAKRTEMAARHAASAPMKRGDLVYFFPDRGEPMIGLLVDEVLFEHYGRWYYILAAGRVWQIDEERVSLWDGPPSPRAASVDDAPARG